MIDKLDFSNPDVNRYFARMAIQAHLTAMVAEAHMAMLAELLYPSQKEQFELLRKQRLQERGAIVRDELSALFGDLPDDILDLLKID